MKFRFKDGTIIEVEDSEGKNAKEIKEEAKIVYKEFKDSQVKDEDIAKKYFVNDEEVNEEEFYTKLNDEVEIYIDDKYDEILDERYGKIKIGAAYYEASRIFRELDPTYYNVHISDITNDYYVDEKALLESGETRKINNCTFRIESLQK